MGLTPEDKSRRDQERLREVLEEKPVVLRQALLALFKQGAKLKEGTAVTPRGRLDKFRKHGKFIDLALIRKLVGDGYLRPTLADNPKQKHRMHRIDPFKQQYRLTKKGRKLLVQEKTRTAPPMQETNSDE